MKYVSIYIKKGFILTTGLLSLAASANEDKRPNVLFCLADDWGWPHAGAYGDQIVKTPSFDQIANDGILFEHAYISSPSCTPSRNALLTGQQFYRLEQGASLHSTLDTKYANFMYILQENGYKIGHFDKAWGPGDYKAGGYTEHPCGQEIAFDDFMKERDNKEPFCFWLGTTDPHRPYPDGYGDIPYQDIRVPEFLPDVDSVKKDIAAYYYEVQRWDKRVGDAIETLKQAGEFESTIIVMTGDHGWPFPHGKGNLYDYGTHVPLAISWGEKVKGKRKISDFVSLTDLPPTFLEAAGISIPVQMTGTSLLTVLISDKSGKVGADRNFIVFGRERHNVPQEFPSIVGYPSRAIRTDGWLYIMNLRPHRWPAGVPDNSTHPNKHFAGCDNGRAKFFIINNRDTKGYEKYFAWSFAKRPTHELYDLANDPDQLNNLAGDNDYDKVLTSLRNKLVSYLRKTDDPRFTDVLPLFDEYPYRADYLDWEEIEKAKEKQMQNKRVNAPFQ
jgi:N-sulfoglucosamine sulfohydrolase